MPCYSPLKGWRDDDTGGIKFRRDGAREKMEVACGQCIGCRLDRSRMWAMRIIHESGLPENNAGCCFITLTYDNDHVPDDWSLRKSDFQKFMKRLRRGHTQRIRFFHVGEYGNKCKHNSVYGDDTVADCVYCNVGRPHYHAILFNVSFNDLELVGRHNGVDQFTSETLQRFWTLGFVQVGELNFQTAAYVARYCLKKVNGVQQDEHYMNIDFDGVATFVLPEYCTMSRRPGIGRNWFEKYKADLFPRDETPCDGVGVVKGVSRYYTELMRSEDEGLIEEVKKMRKAFMEQHGHDYTPQRLMQRYQVHKAQADMLRRTL